MCLSYRHNIARGLVSDYFTAEKSMSVRPDLLRFLFEWQFVMHSGAHFTNIGFIPCSEYSGWHLFFLDHLPCRGNSVQFNNPYSYSHIKVRTHLGALLYINIKCEIRPNNAIRHEKANPHVKTNSIFVKLFPDSTGINLYLFALDG